MRRVGSQKCNGRGSSPGNISHPLVHRTPLGPAHDGILASRAPLAPAHPPCTPSPSLACMPSHVRTAPLTCARASNRMCSSPPGPPELMPDS
ncbi:hypothetical protein DENSPDRAFT_517271 [Dentipellis sp. KUC8613]|nr:hypothetical protein DENSPDRAFT_517271 [Dentipellis sp. KUC8613]